MSAIDSGNAVAPDVVAPGVYEHHGRRRAKEGSVHAHDRGNAERSGPAIRAVLAEVSPDECVQFQAELASALERASAELDLAPADQVLDRWWGIAAIRANPLTETECEQLARARAGDFTGLWERDEAGNWVQL